MQLGHHVGEQKATLVAVRRVTMLLQEVRRAVETDDPTGRTFGEAQVA